MRHLVRFIADWWVIASVLAMAVLVMVLGVLAGHGG